MSKFVRIKDNVKIFVEDHRLFFSVSAAFLSGVSAFYGYLEKKNHQKQLEIQIKTLHEEIKGTTSNIPPPSILNFNCNGKYLIYFVFASSLMGFTFGWMRGTRRMKQKTQKLMEQIQEFEKKNKIQEVTEPK